MKNKRIKKTVTKGIKAFLEKSYQDNIAALSGQSAFFMLLSFIPLLMFACALILILTGRTITNEDFLNNINIYTNNPIVSSLREYIIDAMQRATSGTVIITAVMTLWSAGRGLYCITEGISRIYRLPNKHIWLSKRVFAMGYTLVMLLMFLLGLAAVVAEVFVSTYFINLFKDKTLISFLVQVLTPIIVTLLQLLSMTLALKLYLRGKVEEKRFYSFKALLPGMAFTVVSWIVLSFGIQLYLKHFAASSIYGSIGAIAVIMIGIYFMMYLLLCGIQLNYIYRERFSLKWFKKSNKSNKKIKPAK